ncbi:hypothetical protein LguiA_028628 [Lonicera macranthoides]
MSLETAKQSLEFYSVGLNFNETELTLGLPGESRLPKSGNKRGFAETVDLNLGTITAFDSSNNISMENQSKNQKSEAAKVQVVGWPPVRGCRKNIMKSCKFVKVGVDGAPFLRKIDLEMYNTYQQLLTALEDMFSFFTIRNVMNERKLVDPINGVEYVPTYEDKDGDWMLVGDVPWKMFVESCKRLRVMKSKDAIELGPRTPEKCSSSS